MSRALERTLADFKRHPWLHLISTSTITVALIILGGFFICMRNFNSVAEKTGPQLTATLYLKGGITEGEVGTLRDRLRAMPNVTQAEFKSRASIVADLQAFLGNAGVESLPGSELFPDVMEVQLKQDLSSAAVKELKESIGLMTEVTEADFSEDWIAQYKKIRQMLEIFGMILLAAILIGCSFIIANFMGMRHQSRKNEIDIVRLIGAEGKFILTPFLWEAVIEGAIGSTLALIFLFIAKSVLSTLLSIQWASLLGVGEWQYLSVVQFTGLILFGLLMAFGGSLTVFLRFRENAA